METAAANTCRFYKLWIKGHKETTTEWVKATHKAAAVWFLAKEHGVKTIQVDGFWDRKFRS